MAVTKFCLRPDPFAALRQHPAREIRGEGRSGPPRRLFIWRRDPDPRPPEISDRSEKQGLARGYGRLLLFAGRVVSGRGSAVRPVGYRAKAPSARF